MKLKKSGRASYKKIARVQSFNSIRELLYATISQLNIPLDVKRRIFGFVDYRLQYCLINEDYSTKETIDIIIDEIQRKFSYYIPKPPIPSKPKPKPKPNPNPRPPIIGTKGITSAKHVVVQGHTKLHTPGIPQEDSYSNIIREKSGFSKRD